MSSSAGLASSGSGSAVDRVSEAAERRACRVVDRFLGGAVHFKIEVDLRA